MRRSEPTLNRPTSVVSVLVAGFSAVLILAAGIAVWTQPPGPSGPEDGPAVEYLAPASTIELRALAVDAAEYGPEAPARRPTSQTSGQSGARVAEPVGPAAGSPSVSIRARFEGLNHSVFGGNPPDVVLAAGPSHIVEMTNFALGVYGKDGVLVRAVHLREFFGATNTMFDPRIVFDGSSGRFFATAAEYNGSSARSVAAPVRLAVSASSDPTGTWIVYLLVGGGDPDQPYLGFSDDKVVVTSNGYYVPNTAYLRGTEFWVLNKAHLLAGGPVASTLSAPDPYVITVNPADTHSPSATQYMVGRLWQSSNKVRFYAITGLPGVTAVSAVQKDVTISSLKPPPDGMQAGSSSLIETDCCIARILDASWRDHSLWFTTHTACKPSGDRETRSCLRLIEFDTRNVNRVTARQQFDFGQKGRYLFYPALSIDGSGNLAVVYGFSSGTEFPSVAVAGRAVEDPLNTLKPPSTLVDGTAPHISTRYGDYFGAATDPVDPSVVWVAGEYNKTMQSGRWATYIGSVRVKDFTLTASPASHTLTSGQWANSTIDLASHGGFAGTVALAASVSPAGPTVSLSASSVSLSAGGSVSVQLTIATTNQTPGAGYLVTVRGTSGGLASTTDVLATVNPPGGGDDGGSVAYGTLITLEDGTEIPVQNLRVGDRLLGYDTEAGEFTVAVVEEIVIVETPNLLIIHASSRAPFRVDANPRQTLWTKTAEGIVGWLPVTELEIGDSLFTPAGWVFVTQIEFAPEGRHVMFDVFATAPYFAGGYLDPPTKK